MSDSRNLFLFSQRKWRERLGGGIYWTYSLLVPKGRHRELALKKVKIVMTLSLTVLIATISELFPPPFVLFSVTVHLGYCFGGTEHEIGRE